jgi:hypothetical protein
MGAGHPTELITPFDQIHVSKEIEDHINMAPNFISVSEPARALTADEMTGGRLPDFWLEPAVDASRKLVHRANASLF